MSFHCACYVANEKYLFQTLLSAIQARSRSDAGQCDVILFDLTEHPTDESRVIAEICKREAIRYEWRDPKVLDGLHIMAGRLFLDRMLPPEYEEILYLDGDTQVVGDLRPLLALQPAAGKIAAARDIMVYLEALGKPRPRWQNDKAANGTAYVNSGVIRVNRHDWAAITLEAIAVMRSGRLLPFVDQDAINHVVGTRVDHLSMAWNFPGFMLNSGIEEAVPPAIIHFMSNPRPWQGSYLPWGRKWHVPYCELISRYPELGRYRARLTPLYFWAYKAKQLRAFLLDGTWRSAELAESITALEKRTIL